MGWVIYTKLKITEQEVENILIAIKAKSFFTEVGVLKQPRGWSSECDIRLDDGFVVFSGTYFSEGCSLPNRFRTKARQMGFYKRESELKIVNTTKKN